MNPSATSDMVTAELTDSGIFPDQLKTPELFTVYSDSTNLLLIGFSDGDGLFVWKTQITMLSLMKYRNIGLGIIHEIIKHAGVDKVLLRRDRVRFCRTSLDWYRRQFNREKLAFQKRKALWARLSSPESRYP